MAKKDDGETYKSLVGAGIIGFGLLRILGSDDGGDGDDGNGGNGDDGNGDGGGTVGQAPTAGFETYPHGYSDDWVLDAVGSSDPDGSITKYVWKLPDGRRIEEGSGAEIVPPWGDGDVTLTVVDDDGNRSSITHSTSGGCSANISDCTPDDGGSGNGNGGSDPLADVTLDISVTARDSGDGWILKATSDHAGNTFDEYVADASGPTTFTTSWDSEAGVLVTDDMADSGEYTITVTAEYDEGDVTKTFTRTFEPLSDGGNGGNGDDGGGSVAPDVNIEYVDLEGDTVFSEAEVTNDAGFVSWEYTLESGGSVIGTRNDDAVAFTLPSGGSYVIRAKATNTDGLSGEDAESFTYSPDPGDGGGGGDPSEYDHALTLQNMGEPGEEVTAWVETSGDMRLGDDTELYDTLDSGTATLRITNPGGLDTVYYNGDIERFEWEGGPVYTFIDGDWTNPYHLPGNLYNHRWPGRLNTRASGWGAPVEIALYTSRELYERYGRTPERVGSKFLWRMFANANIDCRIWTNLPIVEPWNEDTKCCNTLTGCTCRQGSVDDADNCPVKQRVPSAIVWAYSVFANGDGIDNARDMLYNEYPDSEVDALIAERPKAWNVDLQRYRARIRGKDSCHLLTNSIGGGCSSVGGRPGVTAMSNVDRNPGWPNPGQPVMSSEPVYWHLHNLAHEVAHNLGIGHGDSGTGYNFEGVLGDLEDTWVRTPTVGCEGCTNNCGEYIENDNMPGRDTVRLEFTDCDRNQFDVKPEVQGTPSETYWTENILRTPDGHVSYKCDDDGMLGPVCGGAHGCECDDCDCHGS
jgi:hypothetical protein